jgi:hypothetical protein
MHPTHMERLAQDRQAELRSLAPRRMSAAGRSPRLPGRPALVRGMGTLLVRVGQRLAGPDANGVPSRLDLAHLRGPRQYN